jgi:hypothetical protein
MSRSKHTDPPSIRRMPTLLKRIHNQCHGCAKAALPGRCMTSKRVYLTPQVAAVREFTPITWETGCARGTPFDESKDKSVEWR